MTEQQSKWNADAEAAMMGFVVDVQSPEHLKHMIGYVLWTLKQDPNAEKNAQEIFDSIHQYNSEGTPVSHFAINNYRQIGTMLTFVRDNQMKSITSKNGALSYVYNLTYPDCSELGYVFFQKVDGRIKRVA